MKFTKPWISYSDQIKLLKSRGLTVRDEARLIRWLKHHNYYRLTGYLYPFRVIDASGATLESFKAGTTSDEVLDLCKFDARLRILFLQGIDRVELSLRSSIAHEVARACGPLGYTDSSNYSPWFLAINPKTSETRFDEMIRRVSDEEKRTTEKFVKSYHSKYTSETHLPIWMGVELMSFGTLSLMYSGFQGKIKSAIASQYGMTDSPFQSWLQALTTLRNTCAHQSRLWNRQFGTSIAIPKKGWSYKVLYPDRLYAMAVVIQFLLDTISPQSKWKHRFSRLILSQRDLDTSSMGFPSDWLDIEPFGVRRARRLFYQALGTLRKGQG